MFPVNKLTKPACFILQQHMLKSRALVIKFLVDLYLFSDEIQIFACLNQQYPPDLPV